MVRSVTALVGVVKEEEEADTTAATMATATILPRMIGTKVSNRDPPRLAADRGRASLVLLRLRSRVVRVVAMAAAVVVVGTMRASEWAAVVRAEAAVSRCPSCSRGVSLLDLLLILDFPLGWTDGQGYGSNRGGGGGGGGGFGGESEKKESGSCDIRDGADKSSIFRYRAGDYGDRPPRGARYGSMDADGPPPGFGGRGYGGAVGGPPMRESGPYRSMFSLLIASISTDFEFVFLLNPCRAFRCGHASHRLEAGKAPRVHQGELRAHAFICLPYSELFARTQDFYEEHPRVTERPEGEVEAWCKERHITIEGKAAKPITSWVEARLPDYICDYIEAKHFVTVSWFACLRFLSLPMCSRSR